LEEEKRPGEFLPIEEDDEGSYLFNSKDICALPYLKEMAEAGVVGFKIEGRSKSIYYLATVASVYRKAIDNMMEGKDYDSNLMDELKKTASRGYSPGFLKGTLNHNDIHYEKNQPIQTHLFAGVVRDKKGELYEVEIRNKIVVGEEIEVMTPKETSKVKIEGIYNLNEGEVDAVHGGAGNKLIKIAGDFPIGSFLRQKA
ncbi:U32 family peptidase C-terminal domain-containing protein, partial [Patescibacteria group bacterium]|nr:U32 family peptidase C-terminal domain-containing protein [Patescibacteria group bacterium]